MQPGNQRAAEVPRRKTQAWAPALHSATHVGFLQASDPSSGEERRWLQCGGAPSCPLRWQGAHSHVETNHPMNGQPFSIWSLCCFQAAGSHRGCEPTQLQMLPGRKCHSFSQQLQKHGRLWALDYALMPSFSQRGTVGRRGLWLVSFCTIFVCAFDCQGGNS